MAEAKAKDLRKKNLRLALSVLAALLIVGLVPAMCRGALEPDSAYPTAAAARAAGAPLPAFVPASAGDVHERHGRGRRFVRFAVPPADARAMTAGMRRLGIPEVKRLTVPQPGWSTWWPISSKTLQGSQGEKLEVYEVTAPADRGYLAVDPRTSRAYYWAR